MTGVSPFKAATLAFGALGILSASALPAFAQEPLQVGGPVIKELEETTSDPIGKVDETIGPVEEVVEETPGPVEEAVEAVEQTTEDTVAQVKEGAQEVVDTILKGPDPETPTQPEGSSPVGPTEPTGPVGSPRGDRSPERRSDRVLSQNLHRADTAARGGGDGSTTLVPQLPDSYAAGAPKLAPQASATLRLPSAASPLTPAEAVGRLAFPIAMTALVVLFLLLQGRLDRRDPKLSFEAHLNGDSLSFE